MSKCSQHIEKFARQLRLVTLLLWGLCVSAHAQTPNFSLPPLPGASPAPAGAIPLPPPSGASNPQGTEQVATEPKSNQPKVADKPAALPEAIPELSDLPTPITEPVTTASEPTESVAEKTPPADEAPPLDVAAPPSTLPGLNLPLPAPPGAPALPAPGGLAGAPPLTILPEVDVAAEMPRPAAPTWKTKLAPAIVPPKTNFIYRRQVMPDAIYLAHYDRENQHLPKRVTGEDYDALLLSAVARNDVNATRALLDRGRSPHITDAGGNSLLQVAQRYGAQDTANLLRMRGVQ